MKYKVLITTSGIGSRLGEWTKYTNKALVKIGDKPAISYIIEAYPKETVFVITLGYFGEMVREFLSLAYPDRKFQFVVVNPYVGEGSSLLYSIVRAKRFLQSPFVFHACDTIVLEKIPAPITNWSGGFKDGGSSQYASFDVSGREIEAIHDKGALDPDYLHIGLVGINDYKEFWESAENILKLRKNDTSLGDVDVLRKLIIEDIEFKVKSFKTWNDIGNAEAMVKTRKKYPSKYSVLYKIGEEIYFVNGKVIKFFSNPILVKNRVLRIKSLKGLVPRLMGKTNNFYAYEFAKGITFSKVAKTTSFIKLLDWAKKRLWTKSNEVSVIKFTKTCKGFYKVKTEERISKFLSSRGLIDKIETINGIKVPKIVDVLKKVDFDWLAKTSQTGFHGDFILDNIIRTKTGFRLIDWRQDFGGLLKSGDMYYDLSKLRHNLVVNHKMIESKRFLIRSHGTKIEFDINRRQKLVDCERRLFEWVRKNELDEKKIKVLSALIWLNMSPLHEHPFDSFLFYIGKYYLWQAVQGK